MKQTSMILMVVTVLAKVFGLAREKALAQFFGVSPMADIFIVALSIPMLFTNLLTGALGTGFIPVYNEIEEEKGHVRAELFTSNVTNTLALFFFLLSLVAIVFARPLVKALSPGFSPQQMETALVMTRIFLLSIAVTAVGSIYRAYLQIHGRFVISVLHPIIMNIFIIFSVAVLSKKGILPMSLGVLFAFIAQFAIFIPFLNKKLFHFVFSLKDHYLKKMLTSILPILISTSVIELNFIINKAIASMVTSGGIAALNYASRLQGFATGIVISSIVTVAYPQMARAIAAGDNPGLHKSFSEGLSLMSLLVIPATVGMMAFSSEIVSLLFKGGAFTDQDAAMTGSVLFYYALSIPAIGFREMLSRIFFAKGYVKIPVINSVLIILINTVLSLVASKYMGLAGLGLATSLSMIIGSLLLALSLKKDLGEKTSDIKWVQTLKVCLATALMTLFAKLIYWKISQIIGLRLGILVAIALGGLVYFALLAFFRVDEVQEFKQALLKRKKTK